MIDETNNRSKLLNKLKELIDSELTEKQWTAITAELAGMPLPQIDDKLGSNTNLIYKCCTTLGKNCVAVSKHPVLQSRTFARHGRKAKS